jgi:hypothetical protein
LYDDTVEHITFAINSALLNMLTNDVIGKRTQFLIG